MDSYIWCGGKILKFCLFILCLLIFSGCSHQNLERANLANIDENQLREEFLHVLMLKDLDRASKYAVYFTASENQKDHILLTQFYILACSPIKAYSHLKEIENSSPLKKKLEGTLAALVTTGIKNEDYLKEKKKEKDEKVRYSVDMNELWKDEWKYVRPVNRHCKKFPQLAKDKRKQYLKMARKMFRDLGPDFLLRDFSLVALAMELDLEITNQKEILKRFDEYEDNIYYKRLANKGKKNKIVKTELKAKVVSDNQIHIKGMNFYKTVRPKNTWLPLVIDKKDLEQKL